MSGQLTFTPSNESDTYPEDLAIYRAVTDPQAFGMNDDGTLVAGLKLELVYQDGYDMLAEEFQNCGVEATLRIHLPDNGLQPNQLYTSKMTNISRDWESGCIDDWDIELVPYTGEIPKAGDL